MKRKVKSKSKPVNWLRYSFDNLMAKGTLAPLLLLLALSLSVLLLLTTLLAFSGGMPVTEAEDEDPGYFRLLYITLLRMLDPGVISGDPFNPLYIAIMLTATLSGLFVISTLIAIVNSGVMQKLTDLRKGRSFVLEKNHTVILGWSFQIFPIIQELIIANENQKNATIAILAEKDKIVMEDEIKAKVRDARNTRIVCRTGNPIDIHDLDIVNLNQAKSIIIIAQDLVDPDSAVIKTILAITNNPNRKPEPEKYHIVAELRDPRNLAIAEIAGKDEVQLVVFDHLISRITAQTCRQPGLSVVFTELLDFSGDEIYFHSEPKLAGKTFVEAMFSFENSIVIGLRRKNGEIVIKPAWDTLIANGDKLIAISEDDDTVVLSGKTEYSIDHGAIIKQPVIPVIQAEKTLILGWNRRAHLIINELDKYVSPGSKITVVAENPHAEKELSLYCSDLENQSVTFWLGDTTNRRILDDLDINYYDHIIVLSNTEMEDVQATDAKTLSTLLHLRDISDKKGHKFSIVSEMLDDRNRELAEITHTDDFIVSVKLDSLMLSQISENKELRVLFEDLFSAGGPSIYIRPVEDYIEPGRPVNFYTVMESARQKGHLAIGFKLQKPDAKIADIEVLAYGVVVNPPKSNHLFFNKGDKVVILSEEDIT